MLLEALLNDLPFNGWCAKAVFLKVPFENHVEMFSPVLLQVTQAGRKDRGGFSVSVEAVHAAPVRVGCSDFCGGWIHH